MQFLLQEAVQGEVDIAKGKLDISESTTALNITGEDFSVAFDKENGAISSLMKGTVEYLAQNSVVSGPELNLYRSPIDNDSRYRKAWLNTGFDSLVGQITEFRHSENEDGSVDITINKQFNVTGGSLNQLSNYMIGANGVIKVNTKVLFDGFDNVETLPRVGLKMALVSDFENIEWYGRGPHENYPDRKVGAFIGQYNSSVNDLFTPYLIPQDNGVRCDVRWMKASSDDEDKPSLTIQASKPFMFSALHYDATDFDKAIRPEYLIPREETILCLDAEVLGIGNGSCEAPTLRKYHVPVKPYEFEFTIQVK